MKGTPIGEGVSADLNVLTFVLSHSVGINDVPLLSVCVIDKSQLVPCELNRSRDCPYHNERRRLAGFVLSTRGALRECKSIQTGK